MTQRNVCGSKELTYVPVEGHGYGASHSLVTVSRTSIESLYYSVDCDLGQQTVRVGAAGHVCVVPHLH